MDEFVADHVRGPTVLVLDNASIHRAGLVQERRAVWAEQGLTIVFCPLIRPNSTKSNASGATASIIG